MLFDGIAYYLECVKEYKEAIEVFNGNGAIQTMDINDDKLTHILSDIPSCIDAQIPKIITKWIRDSIVMSELCPLEYYESSKVFAGVVVKASDAILQKQEFIDGGLQVYKEHPLITHLVVTSDENVEECSTEIKVVHKQWLIDSWRLCHLCPDEQYLFPEPEFLRPNLKIYAYSISTGRLERASIYNFSLMDLPVPMSSFLEGYSFFLDENTLKQFKDADSIAYVAQRVEAAGGRFVETLQESSVVICQRREGESFEKAKRKSLVVGCIWWIYHLFEVGAYTNPLLNSFHYPIPAKPIPGFKNLMISITQYYGKSRTILKFMIEMMGGHCARNLIPSVNYLVTFRQQGTKFDKAHVWNIQCVNHFWIEDCFRSWKLLPLSDNYTYLPFIDISNLVNTLPIVQHRKRRVATTTIAKELVLETNPIVDFQTNIYNSRKRKSAVAAEKALHQFNEKTLLVEKEILQEVESVQARVEEEDGKYSPFRKKHRFEKNVYPILPLNATAICTELEPHIAEDQEK